MKRQLPHATQQLLGYYGLDKLLRGEPVRLYHGTTREFTSFDLGRSRKVLVDKFYGEGLFFVPKKAVAAQYAYAARNAALDASILDDLTKVNPRAGKFLRNFYTKGWAYWEALTPEKLHVAPGPSFSAAVEALAGDLDPNDLSDLARHMEGTQMHERRSEEFALQEEFNSIFFHEAKSLPDWIFKTIANVGLDPRRYAPKVYTALVTLSHVLVTDSPEEARAARQGGYDGVIFLGPHLVGDVPEVAVFDAGRVQIESVDVLLDEEETVGAYDRTLIDWDHKPFDVMKNPSLSELDAIGLSKGDALRTLTVGDDLYVWRAMCATHAEIAKRLMVDEEFGCYRGILRIASHSAPSLHMEVTSPYGRPLVDWRTHPYFRGATRLLKKYQIVFAPTQGSLYYLEKECDLDSWQEYPTLAWEDAKRFPSKGY